MYHDLLGFGSLVASSGGTFESRVGKIALERIKELRKVAEEVSSWFPKKTKIIHFNDCIVASLDIDLDAKGQFTESTSLGSSQPNPSEIFNVIKFVIASARVHQRVLQIEEQNRLGPAGRTIIVLGNRWSIETDDSNEIYDIPELQANLAFSEAFIAETQGENAGFKNRVWENIYINDLIKFYFDISPHFIERRIFERLNKNGIKDKTFPECIFTPNCEEIEIKIFHRLRKYKSVMAHHLYDIEF